MSYQLILSPGLINGCSLAKAEWFAQLGQWSGAAESLRLQFVLPSAYQAAAATDGVAIGAMVHELGRDARIALGNLTKRARMIADPDIAEWHATGCLADATCTAIREAIAGSVIGVRRPLLVGSAASEAEDVEATIIEGEEFKFVQQHLQCASRPSDLLDMVDLAEFASSPDAGIAICSAILERQTGTGAATRWECLASFTESLRRVTPGTRRIVFRKAAELLWPKGTRPSGLEEHALRESEGGGSKQRRSSGRSAWRATVSKGHAGYRLHYWRTPELVTFTEVVVHSEMRISDGDRGQDDWLT